MMLALMTVMVMGVTALAAAAVLGGGSGRDDKDGRDAGCLW